MPFQWRNQIWQSLEEGSGKRYSDCDQIPVRVTILETRQDSKRPFERERFGGCLWPSTGLVSDDSIPTSLSLVLTHTCQPIQFTSIKYSLFVCLFFQYFRGTWPYWKMVTGKHNFHEILLFFKLSRRIEKLSNEQPTHAIAKCPLTGLVQ